MGGFVRGVGSTGLEVGDFEGDDEVGLLIISTGLEVGDFEGVAVGLFVGLIGLDVGDLEGGFVEEVGPPQTPKGEIRVPEHVPSGRLIILLMGSVEIQLVSARGTALLFICCTS